MLPSYPVVNFLVRWGPILAVFLGLAPLLASLVLVWQGASLLWLGAGIAGGAVLWLVVQSYVEVLRILADALMPR